VIAALQNFSTLSRLNGKEPSMKKVTPPRALLSFVLILAFAAVASAQGLVDSRSALSTFPDSQAVLFLNVKRIVGEAMPRILPAAEYQKLLATPQKAGFDVRTVDYAVAGVRFGNPPAPSGMPEFVILIKGSFNADSLLTLARLGLSSQKELQTRQETHGGRTVEIIDIEKMMGGDEPKAGEEKKPSPYPEIAFVALDANTLVAGVPAYVRSAIDALGGGQGQLRAGLVELGARDPQALWSLSAELPPGLAEYAKKFGMPPNSEIENMMGWFKQIAFSNGMDAVNFSLRAAVGTDSAEHANTLSGMVRMGITAVQSAAEAEIEKKKAKPAEARQARLALDALRTFTNQTEGNTLLLGISVPQSTVTEVVRKEFVKKPAATAKGKATPRKPARRKR
jgi:hypothetical protein